MASFETHLTVTTGVVGVVSIPLLSSGMINTTEGILLLFLGVAGGMLPDIDSDRSIPVQITFKILALILPLIIVFNFANHLPLLKIAGVWLVSSLVLYIIFTYIFLPMTRHRGIFHTIGMGVLFGELTSLLMLHLLDVGQNIAILSGIYVTFGFMVHLILDEAYSVDLLNTSLKRSFGSALKVYSKRNILGSFVVNILAIALFFSLPNIFETLGKLADLFKSIEVY